MAAGTLTERRCRQCGAGDAPLDRERAGNLLQELHDDWTLSEDGTEISRTYTFSNYYETLSFVNALAWIAHREDHHPDLAVSYKQCVVRYSTHMIGGLSENDFICAAKADALLPTSA